MRKAVREAKQHTSWLNPDTEYESALHGFIAAVLDPAAGAGFLGDFLPFQHRISRIGLLNSLSQTLLTLTAPGVPDTYQGTELWDFSLVDPDNRRGVDFEKRSRLLEELEAEFAAEIPAARLHDLLARLEDGRGKLFVIWKCLALRARQPALFESGVYMPLRTGGAHARHLCAFARRHGETAAISVAPRLIAGLAGDGQAIPVAASAWGDTWIELPDPLAQRHYRCQFTGADLPVQHSADGNRLPAAGLFAHFPLALLCNA
jgi:(1->4)-alpha-D-glucan 1-alpha-D-glucosylmutase